MKYRFAFPVFALGLSACVHTQELPLAPNVVRLDTQAAGRLFVGQASAKTLHAAAEATLRRGYSHFRLQDASLAQGHVYAGSVSSASGNGYGQINGNNLSGGYTSYGSSSAIYRPTANVGVTVIMFHGNESGASGAFNAAEVLKGSGS